MPSLHEILSSPEAQWTRQAPASESALAALVAGVDFELPAGYLAFLRYSNGGEGDMCLEPGYFRLEPAESVVEYNLDYQVQRFLPGFFAIGSSGGGEMLAIRKDAASPCPIYMVPFVPMAAEDAVETAFNFELFAMSLGRPPAEG